MGIGDSWGTREELLHPRDKNGRFRSKWKMAASVVDSITNFLGSFNARIFPSNNQAGQTLFNLKKPPGARGEAFFARLKGDFHATNAALRAGKTDAATKKYVTMFDRSAVELPDDVILSRTVGPEAFGLTPETINLEDGGIEDFTGRLIADRGYSSTNIGNPVGQRRPGQIRMVMAVPKGTKAVVPSSSPNDREVILDRDQEFRVTKVKEDGQGGHFMMLVATKRTPGATPDPISGPASGVDSPEAREQQVTGLQQGVARSGGKTGGDVGGTMEGVEERRRLAEQQQSQAPAPQAVPSPPGTPPPRTEPVVSQAVGGPRAPGAAPAPGTPAPGAPATPEAPAIPNRAVDLRLAVRDAKVPSPAPGSNRRSWNDAYLGVVSGKKDPIDAVRELDADIEALRRGEEVSNRDPGGLSRPRTDDANRESDISAMEQLRDVIAKSYGLEAPAPDRTAPVKKAAPGAPSTTTGLPKQERLPPPVKKVTKKSTPAARDLSKVTKAELVAEAGRRGVEVRPSWTKDRISAAIRGETLPPVKKAAPAKVSPAKAAPAKVVPGAPGDDLDAMLKKELVDVATREGVERPSGKTKDQLKADIRRMRGLGPAEEGSRVSQEQQLMDLLGVKRKPTMAQLRAFATEQRMQFNPKDSRGELVSTILGQGTPRRGLGNAPAKKAVPTPDAEAAPAVRTTAAETRRRAVLEAARNNVVEGSDGHSYRRILKGLEDGELTPAAARKQAQDASNHYRNNASQTRNSGARVSDTDADRQKRREAADRIDVTADKYRKLSEDLRAASVDPARKAAPAKAAVPGAAPGTAAGKITAGRITPGTKILVQRNREGNWGPASKKTGATTLTVEGRDAVTSGRGGQTRIVFFGKDDQGNDIRVEGAAQTGVPAHQTFIAAPESRAVKLVPEGSVPGPRAQTPVDNAPRKRSLSDAWKAADIKAKGSAGRSINEVVKDVGDGKITPEEGIRRVESDVAFNKDELADIDATLRGDVTPDERRTIERQANDLEEGIEAQEQASKFLRLYFKDEKPTAKEVINVEMTPEAAKALQDGTPDQWRAAAKKLGMKEPKGTTKDEILEDLTRQLAGRELERRGLLEKKVAPAPKAPDNPKPNLPDARYQRIDVNALAEGLDLRTEHDRKMMTSVQDMLDGKSERIGKNPTPAQIGRDLEKWAQGPAGPFYAKATMKVTRKEDRDEKWQQDNDALQAQGESWLKLAERLKNTRRQRARDPEPAPPAPKLSAPEKAEVARVAELTDIPAETLAKKAVAKKKAEAPPSQTAEQVAATLNSVGSTDEVDAILKGRTKGELLDVAKAMRVTTARPNHTKAQISKDITGMVRSRRDFEVLTRGGMRGGEEGRDAAEAVRLRRHAEVTRDLAGMRLANNSKGSFHHNKGLEDLKKADELEAQADLLDPNVTPPTPAKKASPVGVKTLNQETLGALSSREEAHDLLKGRTKGELLDVAKSISVPNASRMNKDQLRAEIVEGTTGRRLDSIATRGFTGLRPGEGDAAGRPDLPRGANAPAAPSGFTREQLMDMRVPELKEIEDELGIERPNLNRGDRIDAILAKSASLAPAKKVAPTKAAPTKAVPTPAGLPTGSAQVQEKGLPAGFTMWRRGPQGGAGQEENYRIFDADGKPVLYVGTSNVEIGDNEGRRTQGETAKRFIGGVQGQPGLRTSPTRTRAEAVTEAVELMKRVPPAKKAAPAKAAPTGTSPIGGTKSTKPLMENKWGGFGAGELAFHEDGLIGGALRRMGDDKQLDVDGEPLYNRAGTLATRAVRGQISQEQLIQELKRVQAKLPAGSRARREFDNLVKDLDAPARAPLPLPDGTPQPLVELMEKLSKIPLARGGSEIGNRNQESEMDILKKLAEDWSEGRVTGTSLALREPGDRLSNKRHESMEGKFEIDQAVQAAMKQLEAIFRDKDRRHLLKPPSKGD